MTQRVQCKSCPWKKSVVPARDIPNGYCPEKHKRLKNTIAGRPEAQGQLRLMACHLSPVGAERECVGWLYNQLGIGNNLLLRWRAHKTREYKELVIEGEQHETFEETVK